MDSISNTGGPSPYEAIFPTRKLSPKKSEDTSATSPNLPLPAETTKPLELSPEVLEQIAATNAAIMIISPSTSDRQAAGRDAYRKVAIAPASNIPSLGADKQSDSRNKQSKDESEEAAEGK